MTLRTSRPCRRAPPRAAHWGGVFMTLLLAVPAGAQPRPALGPADGATLAPFDTGRDRKSTRLNSSHRH